MDYISHWILGKWWRKMLIFATSVPILLVLWIPLVLAIRVGAVAVTSVVISPAKFLETPNPFCPRSKKPTKMILFVHGWRGDQKETWRNFPSLVCQDERFQDVEVVLIDYPTHMLNLNLNLTHLAHWLNSVFDGTNWKAYTKIVIVAHSLGGLIAREMVVGRRLAEDPRLFEILIEIASPHMGADIAKLGEVLGLSRPFPEEARVGSSFIATLQRHWEQIKTRPVTVCFTSPHDQIVPSESAIFQCDKTVHHPQWNHIELAKPERRGDPRYSLPMIHVEDRL
jgi:triacylglycerol esterase/lipase EstA (alpha/beta hydrolase family)